MAGKRHSRRHRRRILRRVLIGGAIFLLVALAALVVVGLIDTTRPVLRKVTVPVPGLTREVTVLHVADVHGRTFGPRQERIETLLYGQRFDAVAINGDLEGKAERLSAASKDLIEVLLAHSDNVFYVHGNHPSDTVRADVRAAGVIDMKLHSEGATIAPDAGRVVIITTHWLEGAEPIEADALLALGHFAPTTDFVKATAAKTGGTRLFLAAHTHGGQVRVPVLGAIWAHIPLSPRYRESSLPVERAYWFPEMRGREVQGLYRVDGAWVNQTAGLGTENIPFRLFSQAEMTVVRLVPAEKDAGT